MRRWINLVEAYLNTYNVECDYGDKHIVEVFQNPSKSEFYKLLGTSEYASLRASLYPDNDRLIVWEGTRVQHHDLDGAMATGAYYIRLFLDRTGISMHSSPDDDWTAEEESVVANSPAIQRIFGKNPPIQID